MEARVRKDEVDLLETAVKTVRFLLKNLVWVILFPLIGLAAGYFFARGKPTMYESRIILKGIMLTPEEMSFLILNYQKSGIPGLNKDDQHELKGLEFKTYLKENSAFAEVTCIVGDTAILRKIEESIVIQLNKEELVKSYFDLLQNHYRTLIREYNEKIQLAESMLENKKESTLILPEIMNMYTRRGELQINYDRKGLISSVSIFKPAKVPSKIVYSMLEGTIAGTLVLVAFLLIKSFVLYYRKSTDASG